MVTSHKVILIIAIVFNTASVLFLGHLITFHVNIKRKGITTYEYIQIK